MRDPQYNGGRGTYVSTPPAADTISNYDFADGALTAPRRSGALGWWVDLTAPAVPTRTTDLVSRERLRKAELTSYSILAVFLFLLTLVSNSLTDPSTGAAVGLMAIGLTIAAVLNRVGRTRTAAYLIPSLMMLVLFAAVLEAKGGLRLIWLPAYDLFVLPIIVSALIADRRAPWVFAVIAIGFIFSDFAVQPHAAFGEIDREIKVWGWWGMVNRHVALNLFAAFFGWLGARSVDAAIRRADRAEELAAMEHQLAEQKRQLDFGIRQILDTHVRIANGDYTARAPLNQDNVLFQIAASLNTLLNRLGRAAQAEYYLQRTASEIGRLRDSLIAARAGRQPLWPAPSGTPVDSLIEVLVTPGSQRPPTPLPPTGTGGIGTAGLNPARSANSGPFGGSRTRDFDFPPRGPNSGPPGGRPMGGPSFSGATDPRSIPGPNSGPAGQSGPGSQGTARTTSWELPDMPPLPDWLRPSDDER